MSATKKNIWEVNLAAFLNQECKMSQFTILDYASTQYELALKEGIHIKWIKPILNKQKNTR